MKQLDRIKLYEQTFKTQVKQTTRGLEWTTNNNTRLINTQALGRIKRSNVDMFLVLYAISHLGYLGNEQNAGAIIKTMENKKVIEVTGYDVELTRDYNTELLDPVFVVEKDFDIHDLLIEVSDRIGVDYNDWAEVIVTDVEYEEM
jgi:hypothetical protein